MTLDHYTMYNRDALINCSLCVCIDCLSEYNPIKIRDWCDNGQTAICPYCWDDTVLVSPKCTNLYTEDDIIGYGLYIHRFPTNTIKYRDDVTYSFDECESIHRQTQ